MTAGTTNLTPPPAVFFRLNQDVAGVGGVTRYLRNEVHSGYYYPVAPKWTAALLGTGGYIFGFDQDMGIQDRFFLGGNEFPRL